MVIVLSMLRLESMIWEPRSCSSRQGSRPLLVAHSAMLPPGRALNTSN